MKKKLLILALFLVFAHTSVFATDFTDIDKLPWAKPYIQKAAASKIVTGYDDGSFRPRKKVTKSEATLMMYRLLVSKGLVDVENEQVLVSRHKTDMDKANIASWRGLREAISYFLENKFITEQELKYFMSGTRHVNIRRDQSAKFLGKALNHFLKENVGGIINSSFKDSSEFGYEFLVYIDLLQRKNIISGDNNNKFNPKNSLTRAEFSKLIVESMRTLEENGVVLSQKVNAVVSAKIDATERVVFYDIEDKTKSYREKIDSDVEVFINGEKLSYKELKVDMVCVLYYENKLLVKVEAKEEEKPETKIEGIVSNYIKDAKILYYRDAKSSKMNTISLDKDSKITKDSKDASFDDIKETDSVVITSKNDKVSSLELKSKLGKYSGIIESIELGEQSRISIKSNENTYKLKVSEKAIIKRNLSASAISALKVGDEVNVETEYNVITNINSSAKLIVLKGKISKITKDKVNKIEIIIENKEKKSFDVQDDVEIFIDDIKAKLFDLKVDYNVNVKLDKDQVISISAVTKAAKKPFVGRVIAIHKDVDVIIVDTGEEKLSVSFEKKSAILNEKLFKIPYTSIREDSTVFVYGTKDQSYVLADRLLVLK